MKNKLNRIDNVIDWKTFANVNLKQVRENYKQSKTKEGLNFLMGHEGIVNFNAEQYLKLQRKKLQQLFPDDYHKILNKWFSI